MKRDQYWDIVKGIGIICIVLGHCAPHRQIIYFVYLFHLPLFFFVSGALFRKGKLQTEGLAKYIGEKILSVWPRFVLYGLVFVLLHNIYVNHRLMAAELYTDTQKVQMLLSYALFLTADSNAGALWFVAPWLITSILFAGVLWLAEAFLPERLRLPAVILAIAAMTAMGMFLITRKAGVQYNVQISLAMTGTMALGYALKSKFPEFRKYLGWCSFLLSLALLFLLRWKFNARMELVNWLIMPGFMHLHILAGIAAALSLAELILRYSRRLPSGVPGKLFAFIGRHSFDIMALHFTMFKLVDWVYIKMNPDLAEASARFPCAFADQLWWAYLAAGLLIPAAIGLGLDQVRKKLVLRCLTATTGK